MSCRAGVFIALIKCYGYCIFWFVCDCAIADVIYFQYYFYLKVSRKISLTFIKWSANILIMHRFRDGFTLLYQSVLISGDFLELSFEKYSKASSSLSRKKCSYGLVISVMNLGLEEWGQVSYVFATPVPIKGTLFF